MKKTLYSVLACIAGAALVAALGRACNNENTINNMQHNTYPMHVDSTELLTIYDITDCPIDLACGQMPDTTQENVLLCAAAAFTGQCLDYFEHSNILGPHVSGGILYEGYTENKEDGNGNVEIYIAEVVEKEDGSIELNAIKDDAVWDEIKKFMIDMAKDGE